LQASARIKDAPYGGINWAGFYVGIQGGYGWGDTSHNFSGLNAGEWDANGGVFGVTWGTNWQRGNWVYGFESDFSFSSSLLHRPAQPQHFARAPRVRYGQQAGLCHRRLGLW
jgi:opacity protein-like surface antigen